MKKIHTREDTLSDFYVAMFLLLPLMLVCFFFYFNVDILNIYRAEVGESTYSSVLRDLPCNFLNLQFLGSFLELRPASFKKSSFSRSP